MRINFTPTVHFISLFFLIISINFLAAQNPCTNADFSMANFSNWTGSTGLNSGGNYSSEVVGLNIGTINSLPSNSGQQTIMTTSAIDPNTGGGLNVLPPEGGYSCRLGNEITNYGAERLEYTVNVTSSNSIFSYQYAAVLEDPSHPISDQPKLTIYIKNSSGNVVGGVCGIMEVSAGAGTLGFQDATHAADGETTRWKDWTTVAVDLSPYIGQNITIEFTTYDCAQGAHFGYAYISCLCGSLEIAQECSGPNVVLTAPSGFAAYSWSTGDNTQIITINNPVNNSTVNCTCTSVLGCDMSLQTTLFVGPQVDLGNDTITCTPTTVQLDAGSGYSSYLWSTGETTQQINVSSSDIYSVTATEGGVGCPSVDSILVGIDPIDGFDLGNDTNYCQGNYIYLDAGNFYDSYQWSTGDTTSQAFVDSAGMYYVTVTSDICIGTAIDSIYVNEALQPIADAGLNDTICIGDCAILTASGGGSYHWNIGANTSSISVCPTTTTLYTVTVYNLSGCSSTDTVRVYILSPLTLNFSHTNTSCNLSDGTATVTPSGGSGSYSYLWNTVPPQSTQTALNLDAGTYTVSVTDLVSGCALSNSVTILNTSAPTVSLQNATSATCGSNDGSIAINCSGGNPPYTFMWNSTPQQNSQTLINVPAGTYCVTVTDASACTASVCATVYANTFPAPEICIVSVDTATNYNVIIWEKPVTSGIEEYYIYRESSISGVYDLIGSQNYSDYSNYTDVNANALQQPYRYKIAINDTCGTFSQQSSYHQTVHLAVNSGTPGQWNLTWNNYEGFTFSTYNIYRGTDPGSMTLLNSVASSVTSYTDLTPPSGIVYYMIEVAIATPCNPSLKSGESISSTVSNIAITNNVGINEISDQDKIQIYPNPSSGIFTIKFSDPINSQAMIEITNPVGQLVYSGNININTKSIDLSELSKGMYLLKLIVAEKSYFEKITLE
jgi:hypothetical protein